MINKGSEVPTEKQKLTIDSDEKRIQQVLMNLQSNALKFTKEHGQINIVCQYVKGIFENEPQQKK